MAERTQLWTWAHSDPDPDPGPEILELKDTWHDGDRTQNARTSQKLSKHFFRVPFYFAETES